MNLRKFLLKIINFFPLRWKWYLFSFSFFEKRLRIDNILIRSNTLSNPSKILVIGANDGFSFDNLFQSLDPMKVSGLVIEPSSKYFKALQANLKEFKNLILVKAGIYTEIKKLKLYQLNDFGLKKLPEWGKGLGSFSKEHLLKFKEVNEEHIEFEYVDGIPFQEIVDKYSLNRIDYLQIDTEGFDAEIIKMIDFNSFKVDIIKFEIVNITISELEEVRDILISKGYVLVKVKNDMLAYSKYVNLFFY